jgi:hypothetical protein
MNIADFRLPIADLRDSEEFVFENLWPGQIGSWQSEIGNKN